jgi:phospholipid/cholesterol/gamma-HCH transport system ATP-binding protein
MQKRAGLARAIVGTPSLLFFDEPTTGLDPITAGAINELIRDRVTSLGCTAVSITHDMASAHDCGRGGDAGQWADRVARARR